MDNWPNLSHAPIVEGLIDIQVEQSASATLDALKTCADTLAADFPSREELHVFKGQFSFSPEAGPSFMSPPTEPNGVVLRSADGKWVAQFRVDGLSLSRLAPYTSGENLTGYAKALWDKYSSVTQPKKVVRIALRYINRISLPLGEPFETTFATTFNIAASLPQAVAGFLLRFVIPFESDKAIAIVTQALPENSQDCIFDIDTFAVNPDGITDELMWQKFAQLRKIKNRLFFESLNSEALGRFR